MVQQPAFAFAPLTLCPAPVGLGRWASGVLGIGSWAEADLDSSQAEEASFWCSASQVRVGEGAPACPAPPQVWNRGPLASLLDLRVLSKQLQPTVFPHVCPQEF